MPQPALGVLVPRFDPAGPLAPPETRPVGRAALLLADRGIDVVFGDEFDDGRMTGWRASDGRWTPARGVHVSAVHDRFPSQVRAVQFAAVLESLGQIPLANPPAVTRLCRDKLACQRFLEAEGVVMPPVEDRPERFADQLRAWGAAFLKPRYGALGVGVRRVEVGDPVPPTLPGLVPGALEPSLLQRAVDPPRGLVGCSLRLLCHRLPGGAWHIGESVARTSTTDPVVNAERGAAVAPATVSLSQSTLAEAADLARAVCRAIADHADGAWVVELGVDVVIDVHAHAHVIEVNSRPRGRLAVLAEQDPGAWWDRHVAACSRPLVYLAELGR